MSNPKLTNQAHQATTSKLQSSYQDSVPIRAQLAQLPIVALRLTLGENARRKGIAKYHSIPSSEYDGADYWTVSSDETNIILTQSVNMSAVHDAKVVDMRLSSEVGRLTAGIRQIERQLTQMDYGTIDVREANKVEIEGQRQSLADMKTKLGETTRIRDEAKARLDAFEEVTIKFPVGLYENGA